MKKTLQISLQLVFGLLTVSSLTSVFSGLYFLADGFFNGGKFFNAGLWLFALGSFGFLCLNVIYFLTKVLNKVKIIHEDMHYLFNDRIDNFIGSIDNFQEFDCEKTIKEMSLAELKEYEKIAVEIQDFEKAILFRDAIKNMY